MLEGVLVLLFLVHMFNLAVTLIMITTEREEREEREEPRLVTSESKSTQASNVVQASEIKRNTTQLLHSYE